MSEVYSKTPPTEPGWYWIAFAGTGSRHGNEVGLLTMSRIWLLPGDDTRWRSEDVVTIGGAFGPRVPSIAEMEAIQADQVRLAWLFRTVLQAWPREKIDAQMARDAELLQACNEEYDTDEDFMDPECP